MEVGRAPRWVTVYGTVFPQDREPRNRASAQPSTGGDTGVGSRIALARRAAGLTQRALADLVGVRLWVVDRWESGAGAVPPEQLDVVATATHRTLQWLETGAGGQASEPIAPETTDADVRIEEPQPEADEPLTEIETARREVDERLAEIGEREARLAMREQELQIALSAQADEPQRHDEGPSDAERDAALAQAELDIQDALAQADDLRHELERERAKHAGIDEARRHVEAARAEVAEREARFEARALGFRADGPDVTSLARWLTDSVTAAAKREAETVVKAAYERARQIIADAKAGREPPGEGSRRDEPS
jgi:HTH-type transcriptional regulator, cell division transcriptional repressor